MGGVVVDDEMDVELLGDGSLDVAQELQELLLTMAAFALREHLTRGDVESREQSGGPVSDIVVRDPFDVAQSGVTPPLFFLPADASMGSPGAP